MHGDSAIALGFHHLKGHISILAKKLTLQEIFSHKLLAEDSGNSL